MKLLSVQLPSLPYLGSPGHIVCDSPPVSLKGWRVLVRGPSLMLLSPHGWRPENKNAPHDRDAKAPCVAFAVARSQVVECWAWDVGEKVVAPMEHDSPPMYSPEDRKAIEMAELEAKTAPGVKR